MQRTLLTVLITLAFLTVLPMTTMAQQEEPDAGTASGVILLEEETASGRTLPEVLTAIETMLATAKDTPPATIAVNAKLLQEWKTESVRIRQRLLQNRTDCASAIRRANRDTLMETATRCVRNDLLQETALLRKQQDMIDAMPLLNVKAREEVREATAALGDASSAILNAIDAGLFSQMDTLRQALRNLHTQYRQTLNRQLSLLRLERERTWMRALQNRMKTLYDADPAAGTSLLPAALCLEEAAALLQSSGELQAVRSKNSECRIWMLQAVSEIRIQEEPQQ